MRRRFISISKSLIGRVRKRLLKSRCQTTTVETSTVGTTVCATCVYVYVKTNYLSFGSYHAYSFLKNEGLYEREEYVRSTSLTVSLIEKAPLPFSTSLRG